MEAVLIFLILVVIAIFALSNLRPVSERIEERIKIAEEKRYYEKAGTIVEQLGVDGSFSEGSLTINVKRLESSDARWETVTICNAGEEVYCHK
ncbi:MAG: hypothetical protein FJ246_08130 [Nitrospira sp.]|nr:hypothetical protein [Nitrospira sp.]